MTRAFLALYTGLGLLMILGVAAYTLSEVYVAFREGATGFWSALFAFRGGIFWAGWVLTPFGVLATLYIRSPRIWKSKSYDHQYAVFATGALLTSAVGLLILTYDFLPFDRSQPRLFFSLLPVPQLIISGIAYTFWTFYGGTLSKRHLTARSTATREHGAHRQRGR